MSETITNKSIQSKPQSLPAIPRRTIERYIYLLEQAFVIFKLPPYSKNQRREINSKRKIFFYDLGIRNALINNFNLISNRDDVGKLWENFCLAERLKKNEYQNNFQNTFYWRTYSGAEMDCLEEKGGELVAYEFKWQQNKFRIPTEFKKLYPNSQTSLINKENFLEFLK